MLTKEEALIAQLISEEFTALMRNKKPASEDLLFRAKDTENYRSSYSSFFAALKDVAQDVIEDGFSKIRNKTIRLDYYDTLCFLNEVKDKEDFSTYFNEQNPIENQDPNDGLSFNFD